MKRGDEITLNVTDVAYGGDGIGRHEGCVVFVPFVIPGEQVRVRVTKAQRQWGRAELLQTITASPDRIAPPCPYFTRCGGCAYQHITYPRQLEIKTQQVAQALRRIGKFAAPPVEPALASPLDYGYRNRITVHVDSLAIGFRGTDPRRVVDIDRCLLADAAVNNALARLRSKTRPRPGPATLRANPEALGFRQVNDGAAELLAEVVSKMAGRADVLVDAYCGAGFFAKRMRGQFARVIGIDWDGRSIEAAKANSDPAEEYHAGDAAELLPHVLTEPQATVVLLDPPAQGVAPAVIQSLLEKGPFKLVYVSCDPATLARDLATLSPAYELQRAVPVDMFPQTASIETACLLARKP